MYAATCSSTSIALMPPLDLGSIMVSFAGSSLAVFIMNFHASCCILHTIDGLGAATMQVYQAFEITRDLKSRDLPAKVSVLAFRCPAFCSIHKKISSHLSSMFFWLSGKVKPRVGGG